MMDENHRYLVFSHIGFLPQAEWREAISTSSLSHQMPLPFFFLKKKYLFLIEGKNTCFTILCWFLPKINMDQPQVYICPFPLEPLSHLPPLQVVTEPWVEFPESYSKFPLAIYFAQCMCFHVTPLFAALQITSTCVSQWEGCPLVLTSFPCRDLWTHAQGHFLANSWALQPLCHQRWASLWCDLSHLRSCAVELPELSYRGLGLIYIPNLTSFLPSFHIPSPTF